MLDPSLGPVVFALISIGIAVGVVAVMAGWRNTNARNTALVTAAIGIVALLPAAGAVRQRTSACG